MAEREVLSAKDVFEQAVQDAGGCGLVEAVKTVVAIVAVASAAGNASSDDQLSLVSLKVTVQRIKTLQHKVTDVVKAIQEVREKYGKFQGLLNQDRDVARIVVDQEDLERLYEHFDEEFGKANVPDDVKARFRGAVRRFLDLVQARNKLILEQDALVLAAERIKREIGARAREQAELVEVRATIENPAVERFSRVLGQITHQQLRRCRELLWMAERAYELWRLRRSPGQFSIDSQSPATLRASGAALRQLWLSAQNDSEGDPPRFNPPLVLERSLSAAERERLATDRRLAFTLSRSDLPAAFVDAVSIFVSRVAVELPGVRFAGEIVQSGRNRFRDETGKEIEFAMAPLRRILQKPKPGDPPVPVSLGQKEGTFVGVSPFSDWLLKLTEVEGPAENLKYLEKVVLLFEGSYRVVAL